MASEDIPGRDVPGQDGSGREIPGQDIPGREFSGPGGSGDLSGSSARLTVRRPVDAEQLAAELFAAQYPRLAGWCRKLVDDDDTAHEVAMEAFTRLIGKLRKVDDPVGYLYVIATNLVHDHWRKTRRERNAIRLVTATARESVSARGEIELRSVVESLPERLRTPVLLHYYAGFGLDDVARLTGRPAGTVKSDLFRARALLRKALTENP
jgi:RNA polymerase sigma-70 factor, ECF subfamily